MPLWKSWVSLMLSVLGIPVLGMFLFIKGEITGSAVGLSSIASMIFVMVAFRAGRHYGAEDLLDEEDLKEGWIYTVVYQDESTRVTVLKPNDHPPQCFKFGKKEIHAFSIGSQFQVGERNGDDVTLYSNDRMDRSGGMIEVG